MLPFGNYPVCKSAADIFYRKKSEVHFSVCKGKILHAHIYVGAEDLSTCSPARGHILRKLSGHAHYTRHQRRHVRAVVVTLQIRGLICEIGISRRMGLIERIRSKAYHLIEYLVCDPAVNTVFLCSCNKTFALFQHYIMLFLRHCTADYIRVTIRVTRKFPADLHYLLLIYHTAVSVSKYAFQNRVLVLYLLGVLLVFDIYGYRLHRAGAVKRNYCDQILKAFRSKFHEPRSHACTFQLENSARITACEHSKDRTVICRDRIYIEIRLGLMYFADSITDYRKVSQSEKVHFQ